MVPHHNRDDPAVASEAWEAIERLGEEFLGPLG